MNLQNNTLRLFGIIFTMHMIWIVMIHNLFVQLKQKHPNKYSELGNPAILDGNFNAFKNVAKFLFYAEFKSLNDLPLIRLAKVIRLLFLIDLVLIFFLLLLLTNLPLKKLA